jgi:hypothetical protein
MLSAYVRIRSIPSWHTLAYAGIPGGDTPDERMQLAFMRVKRCVRVLHRRVSSVQSSRRRTRRVTAEEHQCCQSAAQSPFKKRPHACVALPAGAHCIRQHTSAYVSMHQHTSPCVSIRQHTWRCRHAHTDVTGGVSLCTFAHQYRICS